MGVRCGKGVALNLNRKIIVFISVLTVTVILGLSLFTLFSIKAVDRKVTQYCFDELTETSKELAADLRAAVGTDHTILSAIAAIIANEYATDDAKLCAIMNSYNLEKSFLSYLELLRPDGTMLDTNGTVRDVSGSFDFTRESARGAYISNISQSTLNSDEKVIRNALPVMKDGRTVCMLYGVVRLSKLAKQYTTNIYGDYTYVYIENGDAGDFLLDTWHKTLGNILERGERKTLPGYNLADAVTDMRDGVRGEIVLRIVADALWSGFRHEAIYRVGGNEFVVIPSQNERGAHTERGEESDQRFREENATQRIQATESQYAARVP